MLAAAKNAVTAGCRAVVLQAGHDPGLGPDFITDLIRRIRGETALEVALSLGERTEAELNAWYKAGAGVYLLRFLTANTTLYRFLHAQACDDPRRRLPLLDKLKQLGYRVGTGIMVGFPGQSLESLADDLELIQKLDLDIVLAGPYVWPAELAQPGPRQDREPNSALAVMRVIALARLLCPGSDIPSLPALAAVSGPDIHAAALQRGANVIVLEFTPACQLAEYRCYPGRTPVAETSWSGPDGLRGLIEQQRRFSAWVNPAAAPGQKEVQEPGPPPLSVGVCMGSSCFSRGNNRTVAAIRGFIAENHLEERLALEGHLCAGQCKQGPNASVEGELRQQINAAGMIAILRQKLNLRE